MDLKIEHIIIGVLVLAALGYITLPGAVTPSRDDGRTIIQTDTCEAGCFGLTDSDLQIRTKDYTNDSQLISVAAHSLFGNNDVQAIAASTITAYPHSYATLPTCFSGYIMTGEDNGSGDDYYFTKTPASWRCEGTPVLNDVIRVAAESTVTFTGYDDGTSEATWNITVGTTKVTSAELKIESASDGCIGNPSISRPIAICINGTAATISKFNEIKPTGVSKTIPTPGYMTAMSNVLNCYELPTPALCDGEFYRFYLTIDPVSNPGITEKVGISLIDKTYYQNDDGVYVIGWEDVSDLTSDADVGITASHVKTLNFG